LQKDNCRKYAKFLAVRTDVLRDGLPAVRAYEKIDEIWLNEEAN
jgi:hypothetical protein